MNASSPQGSSPGNGSGFLASASYLLQTIAKRISTVFGALFGAVFGAFIWHPPDWARTGATAARQNPRQSVGWGVVLGIIVACTAYLYTIPAPKPKVPYLTVKVIGTDKLLAPNSDKDKLVSQPIVVRFSGPAAKLDDLTKTLPGDYLGLIPSISGKWKWLDDSRLQFDPDPISSWEPGTTYHAVIRKGLLSPNVSFPETLAIKFDTAPLRSTVTGQELYIDPTDPDVRRVSVTYKFNYPVTEEEVRKHLVIEAQQGKENIFADLSADQLVHKVSITSLGLEATVLSGTITLPRETAFAVVRLTEGLMPQDAKTGAMKTPVQVSVTVPDVSRLLQISSIKPDIINAADGTPQQVVIVETSVSTRIDDVARFLQMRLLPKDRPKLQDDQPQPPAPGMGAAATPAESDEDKAARVDFDWTSESDIDKRILETSEKVVLTPVPSDKERDSIHVFRLSEIPEKRYLFAKIGGGMPGPGKVTLRDDFTTTGVMPVWPRQLSVMQPGALLALNGERKIAVTARAIRKLKYRIGRLTSPQIHHLLSQTSGDMDKLSFESSQFGEDNLTEVFEREEMLTELNPGKPAYGTIDMAPYMADAKTGQKRGIFFLRIAEMRDKPPENPNRDSSGEGVDVAPDEDSSNQDDSTGSPNYRLDNLSKEASGENNIDYRVRRRKWENRDYRDDNKYDPVLLSDRRFIIVTDLGMLVKHNADASRDVFVQSIQTGKPVAGVSIEVIGVNGQPVVSATTDAEGRAALPVIAGLKNERMPIAIVARLADDISFIPFRSSDRRVNLSRFDTGGALISSAAQLNGFIFSDRGIYRPGDTMKLGFSIKQQDWQGKVEGTPLELVVTDARGNSLIEERLNVTGDGFFDRSVTVPETSPTGQYTIGLYTISAKKLRGQCIGSETVRVEEFLPDRMKIKATLSHQPLATSGWVKPEDLKINVLLEHLTGGASEGNMVNGQITLHPAEFSFPQYEDYLFFDPLRNDATPRRPVQEDLADATTDAEGKATLDPSLQKFDRSAFRMVYVTRGFEKNSGRNVADGGAVLVSSLDWVLGYKPDGSLDYVHQGSERKVSLVAVGPDLKPMSPGELTVSVKEQYYVSVLTLGSNGKHAYQSVQKEREVSTGKITMNAVAGTEGTPWKIPTGTPGIFVAELQDAKGDKVAVIRFTVAGKANIQRSLEREAELQASIPKV
ncbi:MAG TPA: MG2 domain-containing protein, partial [Candidatus Methylacidiphilales bacterium]|nr:MG2 domain-containing protein [Candidatus Methylacidiphilales bacterium]